jgi:nondiscriminating glutamyl-tRNA synthetase
MPDSGVRTRFAPSPTGHLHVGGARTAIFNWLYARHHGGTFVIRVEDTDEARSTRESERMVLDDLRWLGLGWDEGPDVGGPHGPYRQSERGANYREVAERLLSSGAAYRCFCDEETLERKRRQAEASGRPPHYDLTCFALDRDEAARRADRGEPHVVRFHVPKENRPAFDPDVTIDDTIRGTVTWRKESLGDFVLLRSGGMPTYNFCVVVDDHDMRISHVIRAEEHLTNTQRQVLIYRALGWDSPRFAHVSLILGEDRSKLSKRHGATSVAAWAEQGYLPEAMLNYLTLLGWSPPDGNEVFSRDQAVAAFDLDRVNKAAAVFDAQKLRWMNGQYLRAMSPARAYELVESRLESRNLLLEKNAGSRAWLESLIAIVQKGADTLADIVDAAASVCAFDARAALETEDVRGVLADESARTVIECLVRALREDGAPKDAEGYKALADRVKNESGQKSKALFMPIRVAVTGATHGPELKDLIPLLDRAGRTAGVAKIGSPLERAEAILEALEG